MSRSAGTEHAHCSFNGGSSFLSPVPYEVDTLAGLIEISQLLPNTIILNKRWGFMDLTKGRGIIDKYLVFNRVRAEGQI